MSADGGLDSCPRNGCASATLFGVLCSGRQNDLSDYVQSIPEPDPNRFDTTFVPPTGCARRPRLYIVGESPGKAEVVQRKPFVGHAGELLNRLLVAAGIDFSEVRCFNAIPFRPVTKGENGTARNRTPTRREIRQYSAVLFADIRRTAPKVIVATGQAAMVVFGIYLRIAEARNRTFEFERTPLFVTYHPQYVAYSGGVGGRIWGQIVADLRRAASVSSY